MSYDDTPHYEREIFLKTRLDVLLKPIVGKLSGKNAPQIKLNDKKRLRGGLLQIVFVNSRGKLRVRLAQNIIVPHGKTGEIGSTKTLDRPVWLLFLPLLTEK